jgi:hypothetical protein
MTMNDTTTTPDTTTTATPAPTAADPRAEALKQLQRGLRDLLARIEQVHETARHDEFEIGCEIDGNDRVLLEHNGEELSGALTEISDELDGVESDLEDLQGWVDALATAPAPEPAPAPTITLEQARAIHRVGWVAALDMMREVRWAMESEAGYDAGPLTHDYAWKQDCRYNLAKMGLPPAT